MTSKVVISIPGKTLIAGEYSILDGHLGLAFTLSNALKVCAKPQERGITIASDIWEKPWHSDSLSYDGCDPLILWVLENCKKYRLSHLSVEITSGLPISAGIGSSSALRLGVSAALYGLCASHSHFSRQIKTWPNAWKLAKSAWLSQKAQQGVASGYDIACQLVGGVNKFIIDQNKWPGNITNLSFDPAKWVEKVHLMYCPIGAPTGPLVSSQLFWLSEKNRSNELAKINSQLIEQFVEMSDLCFGQDFFNLLAKHRSLFIHSPAYHAKTHETLEKQADLDKTWSYKTTGAGGLDALLLFGSSHAIEPVINCLSLQGWTKLNYSLQTEGATFESDL